MLQISPKLMNANSLLLKKKKNKFKFIFFLNIFLLNHRFLLAYFDTPINNLLLIKVNFALGLDIKYH